MTQKVFRMMQKFSKITKNYPKLFNSDLKLLRNCPKLSIKLPKITQKWCKITRICAKRLKMRLDLSVLNRAFCFFIIIKHLLTPLPSGFLVGASSFSPPSSLKSRKNDKSVRVNPEKSANASPDCLKIARFLRLGVNDEITGLSAAAQISC